jgi:hypothetical protein
MKQLLLTVVPFLLVLSSPATAQDSDWRNWPTGGKWSIGAGFFSPDLDTKLIVTDEDQIVGTGISFEQNLGLDDSKGTGLLFVNWRMAKKHALEYRYFQLNRSSAIESGSVAISIGDEIIDIDLPIQSFFDITAHEIAYSYSLLLDERKNLYLGLGISMQDLSLGIQATESAPNPGEVINSTLDSTAPLPTLNVGFDYAFSDNWMFVSRLGWLAVELDFAADESLSGQIINANAGVQWNAFENVGFFLQYQVFDVDVDYKVDLVQFAVDYDYTGPVLGIDVNF